MVILVRTGGVGPPWAPTGISLYHWVFHALLNTDQQVLVFVVVVATRPDSAHLALRAGTATKCDIAGDISGGTDSSTDLRLGGTD